MWLTRRLKFEHGTISYLLTATLTRPTTISPTLTIHHKLSVTGTIDIAHLEPPKPRLVSLKVPSKQKKGRTRPKKRFSAVPNGKTSISSSLDGNSINGLPSPGPLTNDVPPQSPAPSTISSGASTGESIGSTHNDSQNVTNEEFDAGHEQSGPVVAAEEITTAKTELLQGGCLPGDMLQLRISVDHRNPVKTMQGIIITVFRQGRIDTHPALPLGQSERGGKSQYEDYYPKSRTGLGGLSLTSAGSSRVFRQDLAQTIMPLIIDPQSLGASIKTSIQMPDHVFPTITCVPGSMISFKYYVEIVIDLRGRSAGQDRFLPHLSITNLPQHSYGDPKISKIDNGDGISYSATPGFNCLITDQLRRTKDVVFTTTEVIVGTKDSTRARGKHKKSTTDADQSDTGQDVQPNGDESVSATYPLPHHQQTPSQALPQGVLPTQQHPSDSSGPDLQTPAFPLPDFDEPLDEKTRIRRAEERLLPSSPPQDDEPSAVSMAPIAPFAHNEEDFIHRYGYRASAPSYDGPYTYDSGPDDGRSLQPQNPASSLVSSTAQGNTAQDSTAQLESQDVEAQRRAPQNIEHHDAYDGPSTFLTPSNQNAPAHEASSAAILNSSSPKEPKQEDTEELQRQRLEVQASSPHDIPADVDEVSPSSGASQPRCPAASAPTLNEVNPAHTNDDHDYEDLPVYRR